MFIKFDDGWIKCIRETDKFRKKKPNLPTVVPIDLQYVSGKCQSESVGKVYFDDTSVDFLYS